MWMVVRIPAGDITNLHYNFVVAKPLVTITLTDLCVNIFEQKFYFQGVKAHFLLDDSGILSVTSIESVFEKTISVEEQEKLEAEAEAKVKI